MAHEPCNIYCVLHDVTLADEIHIYSYVILWFILGILYVRFNHSLASVTVTLYNMFITRFNIDSEENIFQPTR